MYLVTVGIADCACAFRNNEWLRTTIQVILTSTRYGAKTSKSLCKLNIVKVLFLALHAKQKKTKDLGLKEGNSFRIWKGANVPQNYQNRSIWGLNFINVPNSYEKQLVSWLNVRSGYHNNLKFVLLISSHFSKATMVWQNQQKSSILECFQTS